MNFKIFCTVTLLSLLGFVCYAQTDNNKDKYSNIDKLKQTIHNRRDCIVENTTKKNNKDLIQLYREQTNDLDSLVKMLSDQNDSLETYISNIAPVDYSVWPLPLLDETDNLFMINIQDDNIPKALLHQCEIVYMVQKLETQLKDTDNRIYEINEFAANNNLDATELIKQAISKDIETEYDLFCKINEMDLSTLSESQNRYYQELKDKYNNIFDKYFKDE